MEKIKCLLHYFRRVTDKGENITSKITSVILSFFFILIRLTSAPRLFLVFHSIKQFKSCYFQSHLPEVSEFSQSSSFFSSQRPYSNHFFSAYLTLLHFSAQNFTISRILEPVGVVTFERKFTPKNHMPRWDTLDNNLGNTKIHVTSSGTIEDSPGLLQVDFANKYYQLNKNKQN